MFKGVKEINPSYVLETGFCTGRSTYSVLRNAKNLKKMISIDINFDYRKEGREMRKILENNFSQLETIENSSKNILTKNFFSEKFPNGVDWFTIDGDHSYNGCLSDLENSFNYINKGGCIIIDDYKSGPPNGSHLPQVTKACDDFGKKHPELRKEVWNKKGKGFCYFIF